MFSFGKSRAAKREEQINSIAAFNPVARCAAPDRNTWDIGLKLPTGQVLTLRLTMAPRFPEVAPYLQILGAQVRHPWVDARGGVTGAPQVKAWRSSYVVGRVLKDVMDHFIRNPPSLVQPAGGAPGMYPSMQGQTYAPQGGAGDVGGGPPRGPPFGGAPGAYGRGGPPMPPPPSYGATSGPRPPGPYGGSPWPPQPPQPHPYGGAGSRGGAAAGASPAQPSNPLPHYGAGDGGLPAERPGLEAQRSSGMRHTQMPPLPNSYPRLEELSDEELRMVASDADARAHFVEGEPLVKNHKDAMDETVEANREAAQEALREAADAEGKVEKLRRMQEELEGLQREEEALRERRKRVERRFAPDALLRILSEAMRHAEHVSEDVGGALERGEIDLPSFERDYLSHRTTYHRRRALIECQKR